MALKKAIAYIRVSTEGQTNPDAFGVDAQKEAIIRCAIDKGYEITKWYEEVGSGAEERPILESILYGDEVDNPPVEALFAFKQDRIARDMTLFFTYMFYLKKKNIELITVHDNIDPEDPMWGIRMALIQMIAEQERKNITIRTMAGKRAKADLGGFIGGRAPYGYKVVNGELEIDEHEADGIRLIFKYLDEGFGLRTVANKFNEAGFVSKSGKEMSFNSIRAIRENRKLYEGYSKTSNGLYIKGRHEAIL